MKLEDVPVPISEGLRVQIGTADLLRGYIPALMHSHVSLERKLSLAVAENARLKAALDKYSEDEILSVPLHYELMGVIEDVEHGNGFDTNCLQTLKRVMAQLQEQRVYPKEAIRALKEGK